MHRWRIGMVGLVLGLVVLNPFRSFAEDYDKSKEINTSNVSINQVAGNIYMLQAYGAGNVGVCVGKEGAFMVDALSADLTGKMKETLSTVTDQEIRYMLNTHWHFDHVGGNENLGKSGTTIVAQENVYKRLSSDQVMPFFQREIPAAPMSAWPKITFNQNIDFYLNNEDIHVEHISKAHTDGDAIVFFKKANVLQTGDIYFSGIYPFIDVDAYGSAAGMIKAVDYVLSIINDETKIIPGHGPLSTKKDLIVYRNMLNSLNQKVKAYIDEGKSLEEIQALKPTQEFDAEWADGFLSPDKFVELLFASLTRMK